MDAVDLRPTWRGLIHRIAAPVAAIGFVLLVAATPTAMGHRVAVIVYGVGVFSMFAVSAVYHASGAEPSRVTRILKRVDHGTILLAIAGTYTAVTALGVTGSARERLLVGIWVAAAIGVAVQMLWLDAPRIVSAAVYVVVGWFAIFDLPAYLRGTTTAEFLWVALGGLLYTIGGVIYAVKKPNPWPATFGFHEIFHAFTVLGAAAHFVAVAQMVAAL